MTTFDKNDTSSNICKLKWSTFGKFEIHNDIFLTMYFHNIAKNVHFLDV
jgi:hypothetical protein